MYMALEHQSLQLTPEFIDEIDQRPEVLSARYLLEKELEWQMNAYSVSRSGTSAADLMLEDTNSGLLRASHALHSARFAVWSQIER